MNLLTFDGDSTDNLGLMHLWAQALLILCVLVVTIALVPVLLAVRRVAERTERVLALVEQELPPMAGEVRGLVEDMRALSQEARGEVVRFAELAERARDVSAGVSRVLAAVTGLTRAGQLVGVAAGIKTGLDVFLHRLRKTQGEDHE
jgi:uncharacterized protein YoxC